MCVYVSVYICVYVCVCVYAHKRRVINDLLSPPVLIYIRYVTKRRLSEGACNLSCTAENWRNRFEHPRTRRVFTARLFSSHTLPHTHTHTTSTHIYTLAHTDTLTSSKGKKGTNENTSHFTRVQRCPTLGSLDE